MKNNNKKKIWVLYHADCIDGYAAAWAAWKHFGSRARYKAVRHHTPLPDFPEGTTLYIVDFCYPAKTLVLAAKKANKIVVLDHHISAQKEFENYQTHANLPNNIEVNFIQEHSGCVISWQYFQGDAEIPLLLKHIEDHDLWWHKLPKTREICRALYLRLPVDFFSFQQIKLSTLRREGELLEKQQKLNVTRLFKAKHPVKLANQQGLAVNAPSLFSSDLGHLLAEKSGTFGLTYFYHGARQCYECSLRSIGDVDVSEIAHQYGGGGHKNASGFSVDQATFLNFMSKG